MPIVSAGFLLGFGFRWPMASVNIEARANIPQPTEPNIYGDTVSTQLYMGSIIPCFHYSRFIGCGIAGIGLARFVPTVNALNYGNRTRFEFGGRVGLDFPIAERFAIQVTNDVVWVPDDHLVWLNETIVYKVSPIAWLPGIRLVAAL